MAHFAPGTYEVQITRQKFDVSDVKKTPGLSLYFRPDPNLPDYERSVDLWITDGTIDRVFGTLGKLGWFGTNFEELHHENPEGFKFAGITTHVVCTHRQDGDKTWEEWAIPTPFAKHDREPAGRSVLAGLNQKFAAKLHAASRAAVQPPAVEPVPTPAAEAPASDGEIPF